MDHSRVTGKQLAAARTLAGLGQSDVAQAANISVPTLKRMEGAKGVVPGMANNVAAVMRALEEAGIMFIDSNGNGAGVRFRDPA
jgi:transcriptional regulator with XRE-family HTH domain